MSFDSKKLIDGEQQLDKVKEIQNILSLIQDRLTKAEREIRRLKNDLMGDPDMVGQVEWPPSDEGMGGFLSSLKSIKE